MDLSFTYPYSQPSNFVDLLNSQQETCLDDSFCSVDQVHVPSSQSAPHERRERRPWTPSDDVLLISSWLNTSKDPVIGNEQKGGAFWSPEAYYAASPKATSREHREASHCKQRWHRINDLVCKFCGAYEAATWEKASGQNENDVLKLAHQIFFSDHKKKFTLEHAWKELRNDQKWCELSATKTDASSKKRMSVEDASGEDDGSSNRPPGVKAAKASGKREKAEGNKLAEFQKIWDMKEKDLAMKERLKKMSLLDSLIAKETLSEFEEAFKQKLLTEMLAS